MKSLKLQIIFVCIFVCCFLFASNALAATVTCDTTSALTIPGASTPYSMNFGCAVPAGATASLEIKWTGVNDHDSRDYITCGGTTLYTTAFTAAPYPKTTTTDISTCLRGYNLTSGNRICTASAYTGGCGGYYYGTSSHTTIEYARLTVTYTDGAPNVLAFTPTDGNTTVNMANDLVIYFDRNTYVGTGNIVIKKGADNSTVETIDVTSSQVTGSGTPTITINPSSDLVKNTAYYVQIDATAFNDGAGNNYAGISNTTTWNFTTLNIALPTTQATNLTFSNVTSTSLTLGWTNGNGNGRMVFAKQANTGTSAPVEYTNYTANAAFGSGAQIGTSGWYAIYAGTGTSVAITNLTSDTNYIFHVVEYNTTSGAKVYMTDSATANPAVAFITSATYDTTSALTIPGAQNPYSMNFNCGVPTGATASLSINYTAVGDRDGRDYFTCGGNTLYTTSGIGSPLPAVMTTDISSCVRGYNLATGNRICTSNAWSGSCGGYYYGLAAGHSTMSYARLTVTYAKGSPLVTAFSPADNLTTVSATSNLIISFDRPTYVGSGNIVIKKGADNSTVETIAVTSGQVTGSGTSTITIDPSVVLDSDTAYYVQIDATAFNDNSGYDYAGISNTTTWNFSTLDTTPPTIQANTLAFSSVTYNSFTLSWANGNGDGRIVFAKQANTGTAIPVDNTNYTASATFASGTQISSSGWYTVYKGTGTSVAVSGLTANTDYIFQVFEYDLSGSNPLFLQDTASANPATQTTSALSEPTTQATNLTFSSVSYTSMTVSWTSGNGARRVVFAKQANTGTATPVDDTAYTASATFGSGTQIGTSGWYAVYNSTGTSVSVSGLTPGTDYIFQVFEFNTSGSYYNYNANSGTNNPKSQATIVYTEPTTQAYSVSFASTTSVQSTISWTNGNGTSRVVFVKAASSGTASPVDNTTYTANTVFGSGTQISSSGWYCVYNSTGTSVTVTGLSSGTTYIAQVFEYNGTAGTQNYFLDSASNNPKTQATLSASVFTYTGSNQTFTVPSGVNQITVKVWGAGGAGGTYSTSGGGSGGYAEAVLNVTPGASLIVVVGEGGKYSTANTSGGLGGWPGGGYGTRGDAAGGGGGGVTGVFLDSYAQANALIIAGSGGGGTGYRAGGAGGGSTGNRGGNSGGYGGTQVAGGTGSTYGADGSALQGGNGDTRGARTTLSDDGGGGGGGYFGGEGGFQDGTGGGGGSGYASATYRVSYTLTAGTDGSSSDANPPNTSDASYVSGVGVGKRSTNNGGNGLVVITYSPATTYTLTYVAGSNGSISGSTSQTVNSGSNGTQVTAVADTGYSFTSWDDGTLTASRTDTNVLANHTYTASFAINAYTLTYSAGTGGSISGSISQTVNYNSSGSQVTAVANSGYHFTGWDDGVLTAARTDTNVTANHTYTASFAITDSDAPVLDSVTPYTSSNGAIITWNTNEDASSLVSYGLTSSCTEYTTERDILPRIANGHSVTISNLVRCTRYYYKAQSTDANTNTGYSGVGTFKTTGCTNDAVITATEQAQVAGSQTSLIHGNISLTIPAVFTQGVSSAYFQANKLDNTTFVASAGAPDGFTRLGTDVFTLKALTDAANSISSFDEYITVTMDYSAESIGNLNEDSLWIYRYDGSIWSALENCTVNKTNHKVTCYTKRFSDFALFGQPQTSIQTSGTVTASSGAGGNALYSEATKNQEQKKNQVTSIVKFIFTKNLYMGIKHAEVKELQKYLNKNGFVVANSGDGSVGNETEFFGKLTKKALIKFQEAYRKEILEAVGAKVGTGYFGSATRNFVNK